MKYGYKILTTIFGIVICLLVSAILVHYHNIEYIVMLGDDQSYGSFYNDAYYSYGDFIYEEYSKEQTISYCDSFSMKSMKSADLLSYIENDCLDIQSNIKISQYLKNAKYIFLSIGMNDILSRVTVNNYDSVLEYDKDAVKVCLELVGQNLYETIQSIKSINERATIAVVGYGLPSSLSSMDVLVDLNNLLEEVSDDCKVSYVDVDLTNANYFDSESLFFPNVAGQYQIANLISLEVL